MEIHTYAKQGNIEGVAQELSTGAFVDSIDEAEGRTPLMCAVCGSEAGADMMRFLIERGANINAVCHSEWEDRDQTVLGLAVRAGDLDKVKLLLDAGADINYQRPSGYDVLIDAIHSQTTGDELLKLFELLIEHGAPLSGESDYGESALSVAARTGNFEVIRILLAAGADPQPLEWTELMYAIALGGLQDVERLLAQGADLSVRDRWSMTPWLLSLQTGDIDKAKLLLAAGADRQDRGRCGKTPMIYPIETGHPQMLKWLIEEGFDLEDTGEYGDTALMTAAQVGDAECVRLLLGAGAQLDPVDHIDQRAIAKASTCEVARLLLAAGEYLNDIDSEVRALLTGVEYDGELHTTREDYLAGKHRRFGNANPQLMDIAFWKAMVRSGVNAYTARAAFDDTERFDDGPVWCFQRFGKSITELPDGRFIEIAGEHEDYYDADFCIYNDVIVHSGGGKFEIYGYPEDLFPPTDFHTATLVGSQIYIIGCLGYPEQRVSGETPVYRLDCETFAIEKLETTGDNPGWISRHKAVCNNGPEISIAGGNLCATIDGKEEYFDNTDTYVLDLATLIWRNATPKTILNGIKPRSQG